MNGAERYRLWLAGGVVVLVVVLVAGLSIAVRGLPVMPWAQARDRVPTTTEATPSDAARAQTPDVPTVTAPASALVSVQGDAASSPQAAAVVDVLTRHFTSINERDYDLWVTTVTARRSSKQPVDGWQQDFSSTTDGSVVVSGIVPTATGVAASLTFVSTQNLAHAPPDLPYTRLCWSTRWPLEGAGEDLRIGLPSTGTTHGRPC